MVDWPRKRGTAAATGQPAGRNADGMGGAELRLAQEARSMAEARYLDRRSALFPDVGRTWHAQLQSTERLAGMASSLAEIDEVGPAEGIDPDAMADRTASLFEDLVQPARSTALAKISDGERARRIATDWLRPKLESSLANAEADSEAPTL